MSVSVQVPIPTTVQVPSPFDTNARPFEHSFGVFLVVKIAVSFMVEILSGLSSVIHVGCLGNSHERRPLLGIGLAPITPFGAGLAGLEGNLFSVSENPKVIRNFVEITRIQEEMRKPRCEAKLLNLESVESSHQTHLLSRFRD